MTREPNNIDWKKVDDLLVAGSSGAEIAANMGIHPTTLYNRCVTDKEMPFCDYSAQKRSKGDSLLRAHQFAKALGFTDKGDNTLLIWLGKVRLKQMTPEDETQRQTTYNIMVPHGLAIGSNVPTAPISTEPNQSPE